MGTKHPDVVSRQAIWRAAKALASIFFASLVLAAEPSRANSEREGIVTTQSTALRVRIAPSTDATAIAAAERGERVVILDQSGDRAWYQVRTVRGDVGWVSTQYVTVSSDSGSILGFLLLVGVVVLFIWLTRRRSRANEDRSIQWRESASEIAFDGDNESLLGRTDPIDGTDLVVGEEVFVCQVCSTAYRADSLDYVRRQREGRCVSCRQPISPRKLTVRALNVVALKQTRSAR